MNEVVARVGIAGALLVGVLGAFGCAATEGGGGAAEGTVYLSVPTSGPDAAAGRDIAAGAKLALDQAEGEAGGVEVSLEVLDDAGEGREGWDAATVGENARTATQDASALAYIGDFTSGATRVSLPLTNGAGLLQVSPSASAMDLVREPGSQSEPNETYAVGGQRTFVRVIPGDARQAEAAAELAERLDLRRVVIADDGSDYGEVISGAFAERARELGIGVGNGGGDPLEDRRSGQQVAPGEDLAAYLAVEDPGYEPNSTVPTRVEIEPDALVAADEVLLAPGPIGGAGAPKGTLGFPLAVTGTEIPSSYGPAGEAFVERFDDVNGRDPGRYAAYGYEAMALTLDSIERAAGDGGVRREDIVAAAFDTRDRESILGTYSIDESGETTLEEVGAGIPASELEPFAGSSGRLESFSLPELRRQLGD